MKKINVTLAALCALAGIGMYAYGRDILRETPRSAEVSTPVFLTYTLWDSEWPQATPAYGFYEITPPDGNVRLSNDSQLRFGGSCTPHPIYRDGVIYYVESKDKEYGYGSYGSTIYKVDAFTMESLGSTKYEGSGSNIYGYDMTYDYTTGKAYAVACANHNGSISRNALYYNTVLNEIDLDATTGRRVGGEQTGYHLFGVAADASGQLWAVGNKRDNDLKLVLPGTFLCKVSKTDGSVTEVAQLSENANYSSPYALTFDLRTGKLYMIGRFDHVFVDDEYQTVTRSKTCIYEINTTSGAMTPMMEEDIIYGGSNSSSYAGLMIRDSHPKAPAALTDLGITGDKVTFTIPDKTYDGSELTGELTGTLWVDGSEPVALSGLVPGEQYASDNQGFTAGTHTLKVVLCKGELKSVYNIATGFKGNDVPGTVGDITMEQISDATVKVSWTAPAAGAEGGAFDEATLRYKVERLPEATVIAQDLTETTYTDNIDRKMGKTGYRVTAYTADGAGAPKTCSSSVIAGTAHPLPYFEDFQTQEGWYTYTTIDANNDMEADTGAGAWWWGYLLWGTGTASYNSRVSQADDYLITPAIDLKSDHVYRLQFQTYGLNNGYLNKLQVKTGNAPTVDGLTKEILDVQYVTQARVPTLAHVVFRPEEGHNRIGFRNYSSVQNNPYGQDHMDIDNIQIIDYGLITVPDAPTDLEGTSDPHEGTITLTFNAPTKNVEGNALESLTEVRIYRNQVSEPVGVLTDVAPGKALTFTDTKPARGENTYQVVAVNADGPGLEAFVTVNSLPDIPAAPHNVTMTPEANYTVARLSWEQDYTGVNGGELNEFDIAYEIYRIVGVKETLVENAWMGKTYVDREVVKALQESDIPGQGFVSYRIVPRTSGGAGTGVVSDQFLAGRPYSLPFMESWPNQAANHSPWLTEGTCDPMTQGYSPVVEASDGDHGMMVFEGAANLISPRVDISGVSDAKFSFYVYHHSGSAAAGATVQAGCTNGSEGETILATIAVNDGSEGWKRHECNVPEKYAAIDDLRLTFHSQGGSSNTVYLDQVEITGDRPDYEVKVDGITAPAQLLIGSPNKVSVEVSNLGANAVSNVEVSLEIDGENVGTRTLASIASGAVESVEFEYTPSLDHTEGLFGATATIRAEQDGSEANNTLTSSVRLTAPMLPYVTDLTGGMDEGAILLKWSDAAAYPHQEYVDENVDGLEAFAIQNMGGWSTIDVDGAKTAKIAIGSSSDDVLEWTNAGEPQAWIVFNAVDAHAYSIIQPRSGEQCFISFESVATNGNDDWLISPQLSGEKQTVSFYAKCLYPMLLNETFEVYISKNRKESTSDFTECLTGSEPVAVTSQSTWTRFTYELPEGTRYFAIRCTSEHQFGLMIDDITYSPAHDPVDFYGYNVYRDGEKLNSTEIGDGEYADRNIEDNKEYRYNVTAVYDKGESIFSNPVVVKSDLSGVGMAQVGEAAITVLKGGVRVSGAAGADVLVCNIDGTVVYAIACREDVVTLPLSAGTYVVKVGNEKKAVSVR